MGPSLYKQAKSKYWWVDVTLNGKRHRISLKETDRKTAGIKATLRIAALRKKHSPVHLKTFGTFAEEYLEYIRPRKTPGSIKADMYTIKRLKGYFGEDKRLAEISVKEAFDFFTAIASDSMRPIKPVSANFYLRGAKSMFETAFLWRYVSENVFRPVKQIPYEKPLPRALKIGEVTGFIQAMKAKHPELVPLVQFLLLTGARRGEALSLKWENVDFDAGTVAFIKTKGKRPRVVPMAGLVRSLLHARRELPAPFPFDEDRVSRKVGETLKAANIHGAKLHDLRKSFSSHLAALRYPDFLISHLLGHQDREVTDRHYIDRFSDTMQSMVDELQKTLFGSGEFLT